MTMTSVNIRMDADIKRQADELFQELGMTMSTAMNIFVRQAIQHHGIPFDIVLSPKEKVIIEASQEALSARQSFTNVDDLFEDLLNNEKN